MDLVELVMLLMLMSCRAEVLSLHHFYHGVPVLCFGSKTCSLSKSFLEHALSAAGAAWGAVD